MYFPMYIHKNETKVNDLFQCHSWFNIAGLLESITNDFVFQTFLDVLSSMLLQTIWNYLTLPACCDSSLRLGKPVPAEMNNRENNCFENVITRGFQIRPAYLFLTDQNKLILSIVLYCCCIVLYTVLTLTYTSNLILWHSNWIWH